MVVGRVSDGVKAVVLACEENVLMLICGYPTQNGRRLKEKQSFYDELKGEWDMHSADDLVMCLGNFNGHIPRLVDGLYVVRGWYYVGQRNLEGRML